MSTAGHLPLHLEQVLIRDFPLPPPGLPLHVIWLTNPLVYRIKLHGVPFNGTDGRPLFCPPPIFIYMYTPKPIPCCKLSGKSLTCTWTCTFRVSIKACIFKYMCASTAHVHVVHSRNHFAQASTCTCKWFQMAIQCYHDTVTTNIAYRNIVTRTCMPNCFAARLCYMCISMETFYWLVLYIVIYSQITSSFKALHSIIDSSHHNPHEWSIHNVAVHAQLVIKGPCKRLHNDSVQTLTYKYMYYVHVLVANNLIWHRMH